jgi:hypothetical protein
MRPSRLLVDGLGTECAKIEKDIAIANAQDVDQSPSMASLTRIVFGDSWTLLTPKQQAPTLWAIAERIQDRES